MKIKKYVGILVAVLCIVPIAASALTSDDVQARVQGLLSQIASLTAQIRALQGQVGTDATVNVVANAISNAGYKHRVCNVLDRAIAQGETNDDVRSLQEFLRTEGYLNAEATGYFGALTREALIRYQASQGVIASADARVAGAGLFGPKTKERLRVWCGGGWNNSERFSASPTSGEPPLTVSFSTWLSGFRVPSISYMINFGDGTSERATDCPAPADACTGPGINTHTYSNAGVYTATLVKRTDPCAGQVACRAAIHEETVAKQQITVGQVACTKEYKPVCASKQIVCITTPCNPIQQTYGNRCMAAADNATVLYEGACRTENPADDPQCKAWYDGCNSCSRTSPGEPAACTLKYCSPETMQKAYCTARFENSGNKPPTISGFSGPTTLTEDATGTWTVKASDPEGGSLSYQIWWGDENIYASNYTTAVGAREFTQSTTFTHAYANPGTYTVSLTIRDSGGQEAKTTATVKVNAVAVGACTMQYDPICGRPSGCANTCAPGMYCTAICQLHKPVTYSNRCFLESAGASVIHDGECTSDDN